MLAFITVVKLFCRTDGGFFACKLRIELAERAQDLNFHKITSLLSSLIQRHVSLPLNPISTGATLSIKLDSNVSTFRSTPHSQDASETPLSTYLQLHKNKVEMGSKRQYVRTAAITCVPMATFFFYNDKMVANNPLYKIVCDRIQYWKFRKIR